ncbi:GH39 family glycosyl hydrolase [Paenibacillus pinistramenti]|uniref:GH39 family glycosyl hydrolase n=1 Tax=Paenibacillus pinistramenti TaxID=1768003 RepID=UPI001107D9F6|nr:helix-turn-helix domain-containing protein [Paenibacillus pinistramenti]
MENGHHPLLRVLPELSLQISMLTEKDSGSIASPDIQILFVLQGSLTIHDERQRFTLGADDFILFHPGEEYRLESAGKMLAARFQLPLDVLKLFDVPEGSRFSCSSAGSRQEADEELRRIFTEILSHQVKPGKFKPVMLIKSTFELLYLLLNHYRVEEHKPESPQHSNKPNQRLLEICAYVHANFKQPLTLNEVAELHYVSVPYLSKSFKKTMGMTFSEYLNKIRLEHALAYLLYTDQPITRIALDSGFPSLAAFNRVFRETYQVSPSQYRKAEQASPQDSMPNAAGTLGSMEEAYGLEALLDSRLQQEPAVTVIQVLPEYEPRKRSWKELINIGYARDLLNSDLQEQLPLIHGELGFSYARIWGIFSDDMLIKDPSDPDAGYNFNNVDKVIDALIRNHLKPYIDLGDKPKLIQKNLNQKMVTTPAFLKSRGAEEWKRLIRAFLIHCINRYGSEEVESWYFELWHSSKHAFLTEEADQLVNCIYRPEEMEQWFDEYFVRFEMTWREMKELLPGARLGGCGLSMDLEGRYLPMLLDRWGRREIQPDFLSVYLYPYEFTPSSGDEAPVFAHSPDEQWMLHTLQSIRTALAEHNLGHLPLHVSEWSFSVSNRDFLNDSLFKASYILKNMSEVLTENCMMGYWIYSDIYSEFTDSKRLLYGGAGLISKNGIKKPAYHAFAFLNRMGRHIAGRGRDFLLTKRSGDRYQLLSFHYRHFGERVDEVEEMGASRHQPEAGRFSKPQTRKFRVEGLRDGIYRLKRTILSSERGSILKEWTRFGAVHDIRPDEILFLKQTCVPCISVEHVEVREGWIEITSSLRPHEGSLIELELRVDAI